MKLAFAECGIELVWQGKGVDEKAIDKATGKVVVAVNPEFFRPAEVELLLGDSTKARTQLGWQPKYDLASLAKEMVAEDFKLAEKEKILADNGYAEKIHHVA